MNFADYLKLQLTDFAECYQKHFRQTLWVTIIITALFFVLTALLLQFSDFEKPDTNQISLLSYFFRRYSKDGSYRIIDLSKTLFIFFIALFSVGFLRINQVKPDSKEISFKQLFKSITIKDILVLTATLFLVSFSDYILYRLDYFWTINTRNMNAGIYFHSTIFNVRIYLPLIAFSVVIYFLTSTVKIKITFKRLVLLYISLWLFNEFAFEISNWVRSHIFGLVLMPFANPNQYFLFESFIGIPLIAFYFLGYYSAMTTSLKLSE